MTDEHTKPRPLKVTTCFDPTGQTKFCYALIEDTHETKAEHRAWHRHEEAVKKGLRDGMKDRDDTIASLRSEVADLRGDVKGIELPEPTLGIEINRDGWSDPDDADEVEPLSPAMADAYEAFASAPPQPNQYGATGTVF